MNYILTIKNQIINIYLFYIIFGIQKQAELRLRLHHALDLSIIYITSIHIYHVN